MISSGKKQFGAERVVLAVLLLGLVVSVAVVAVKSQSKGHRKLTLRNTTAAKPIHFKSLEVGSTSEPPARRLFSSELRVVAIGSAFPISYEAEICPFSKIKQPTLDQLDRDGDGITDDWELKYGLDKYNRADAAEDPDADGFVNLEEFHHGTDPNKEASHPPYATKLRFVKRRAVPFPVVFQGVSKMPDGELIFQLNTPSDGRTYFKALGEDLGEGLRNEISADLKAALKGIVLQRFIPGQKFGDADQLVVTRRSVEVVLDKGKETVDPESEQGEFS